MKGSSRGFGGGGGHCRHFAKSSGRKLMRTNNDYNKCTSHGKKNMIAILSFAIGYSLCF